MARAPRFPDPGTEAFDRLSPEEKSWVELVFPWFCRAVTALHFERALADPILDEFTRDPALHVPRLIQFFPTHPPLFERTLELVTSHQVGGKNASEIRENWERWCAEKYPMPTRAAE